MPKPATIIKQLKAKEDQVKFLAEIEDIMGEMLKSKDLKGLTTEGAKQMVYQQKRAMLREFIDLTEGKGIKVRSIKDFDIYFSLNSLKKSRGMRRQARANCNYREGDWRGEWQLHWTSCV